MLIDAFALTRDLDGAIEYTERVNDGFRRSGALGNASTYILRQALLMLERGDSPEIVLPLVEEAEGYTSPYDVTSVYFLAACRAILAGRADDADRANELVDEVLRAVDQTHELWTQADLRRLLSEVPRRTADVDLERRLLREAGEMYARKEIRSYDLEIQRRLDELDEARP
jgi:hypothetical protein